MNSKDLNKLKSTLPKWWCKMAADNLGLTKQTVYGAFTGRTHQATATTVIGYLIELAEAHKAQTQDLEAKIKNL